MSHTLIATGILEMHDNGACGDPDCCGPYEEYLQLIQPEGHWPTERLSDMLEGFFGSRVKITVEELN